ncbi:uncharacterized protein LOC121803910 [Salvia splendens]|uniref:uncharacterized protein LOC121803910 n=1 Tax=Salvia splendens TaxID=180675 RepID=UPI001C26D9D7|nr:uncharacterized protein LOC121803910 [Salvia splendens]
MENGDGNDDPPPLPSNVQLQQQLEDLQRRLDQRQNEMAENNVFRGRPTEDPNKHLTKFIQMCNTTKINGVTDEQIRLRVFPFSLEDDAKDWLDSMEPNSIRTWEAMVEKFLEKYYPPSEALKRQSEIISFEMTPQESIRGAWERFKGLMKRCPNHGLNPTHQVLAFYRGCLPEAKRELNLSAGGSLLKKGEAEAMEVIERVTSNDEGWNNERSKVHRVASAAESSHMDSMYKQMELIHKKLDLMGMGPAVQEQQWGAEDVNYIHQGGNRYYNNSRPNQGGGGYNHFENNAHPNLSYGNPNNVLQPPPGFTVSQGMITEPQKKSSEDILNAFMTQSHKNMRHFNQRLEKVENNMHGMAGHMKSLETQMSQIAQAMGQMHQSGQFPKEEEIEVESPLMQSEVQPEAIASPKPKEVKILFPQVVQKKKLDEKFVKFLEIFKRVHLNIPLIGALQQMPGYIKFLKEIMSKKKRLIDYETVNLTENYSAIIQQKMPAKMKDPGRHLLCDQE